MRNRAKCKLCSSIIESFHRQDFVFCKCGEIAVEGGQELYKCYANDYMNFLRVDDDGNEIVVKVEKEDKSPPIESNPKKPSRDELLHMLDEMVKSYEKLPQAAMCTPITHYDFYSFMILISSILKS